MVSKSFNITTLRNAESIHNYVAKGDLSPEDEVNLCQCYLLSQNCLKPTPHPFLHFLIIQVTTEQPYQRLESL